MSSQCFCTPDGIKFFNTDEEMMNYIEEKCGKDVAQYFSFYDDILEILYNESPYDYAEALEQFDIDESCGEMKSPIIKIKRLKELKEKFEDLVTTFKNIYKKI